MKKGKLLLAASVCAALLAAPAWADEEPVLGEVQYVDLFQTGSISVSTDDDVSLMDAGFDHQKVYDLIKEGLETKIGRAVSTVPKQEPGDIPIDSSKFDIDLSKVDITSSEENQKAVSTIFSRVVNDNPQLFYVRNASVCWTVNGKITHIRPYLYDDLVDESTQAAFDKAVKEAQKIIPADASKLETAMLYHDYLIENCAYNPTVHDTGHDPEKQERLHSAYSALVDGDTVCQGFSLAYKLLLESAEIDCTMVSSEALNHMWNVVKLGDNWYHVDITWDDPFPDIKGYGSYDYFLLSTKYLVDMDTERYGSKDAHHTEWGSWKFYKDGVTCTSDEYQNNKSTYAFCNGASKLHRVEPDKGERIYYYMTPKIEDNTIQGYHLSSTDKNLKAGEVLEERMDFAFSSNAENYYHTICTSGVAWDDKNQKVYYVLTTDSDYVLCEYDMEKKIAVEIKTITNLVGDYGTVGLELDSESNAVNVFSPYQNPDGSWKDEKTNPVPIPTELTIPIPSDWQTTLDNTETGLATYSEGIPCVLSYPSPVLTQVGIYIASKDRAVKTQNIYLALYTDNTCKNLKAVRPCMDLVDFSQAAKNGLAMAIFDLRNLKDDTLSDTYYRLFILDDKFVPLSDVSYPWY